MKKFTSIIEKDNTTGLFIGYIPGIPGAHSQGETVEELKANLKEVIAMLLEEGQPEIDTEFIGTQQIELPD